MSLQCYQVTTVEPADFPALLYANKCVKGSCTWWDIDTMQIPTTGCPIYKTPTDQNSLDLLAAIDAGTDTFVDCTNNYAVATLTFAVCLPPL